MTCRVRLSCVMLLLAAGGLLFMHALDLGGHTGPVEDRPDREPAAAHHLHEPAPTTAAPASDPLADPHERADHRGVAHVISLCVAVLAVVGTLGFRRSAGSSAISSGATARSGDGRALRAVDLLAPPGPGRVALCILRI